MRSKSLIDVRDPLLRVQRKHAGWNTFQNGFDVPAALFQGGVGDAEFAAGGVDLLAAGFQFLRHAVEGLHQVADFIGRVHFHAVVQATSGNFLGGFGEGGHRTRDQLRKKQGQPGGENKTSTVSSSSRLM